MVQEWSRTLFVRRLRGIASPGIGRILGEAQAEKTEHIKRLAFPPLFPYHRRRTGGRVVEGTALEMRRTCKRTVGSNPTLSAKSKFAILRCNSGMRI